MKNTPHIPTVYLLIGVPGSGKSTWANKQDKPILSSDAIREELTGSAATQHVVPPQEIFRRLDARVEDYLHKGSDVIYDATNVEPWHREASIKRWREKFQIQITGVLFTTPVVIAKERNRLRNRVVRDEVIDRYAEILKTHPVDPHKEGFTTLIEVNEHGEEDITFRNT